MIRQPLTLPNGSVLPNRIVKSAMSEALADELNNTTEQLIKLFERWGKSGAALQITGNTPVDRWHLEHAGNFVLDEQSDMKRARKLASAAKCGGALVLLQLSHAGRQTPEAINSRPLSISDLRLDLQGCLSARGHGHRAGIEPQDASSTDLPARDGRVQDVVPRGMGDPRLNLARHRELRGSKHGAPSPQSPESASEQSDNNAESNAESARALRAWCQIERPRHAIAPTARGRIERPALGETARVTHELA